MLQKAFIRTMFIAVLVLIPMSITQLIKDTFKLETLIITLISILVVGVPFYYFIERKYRDQKND